MKPSMKTALLPIVTVAATLAWGRYMAVAHDDHADGHSHAGFSAGEPGDPKKPAKIVQITMMDRDGKMMFEPAKVEVKAGEQVKFMLQNAGEIDHEFVLATAAENLEHAEAMKKTPEMAHDDPNAKRLLPKQTAQILWRFTKAGEFEYGCLIPGHREAGMIGTVTVR